MSSRRTPEDFAAEVNSHLELEIERLVAQGHSPEAARAMARRQFGNLTQATERFYLKGRWQWLDRLTGDVRQALRGFRRRPGFATAAITSLALGIGLTAGVATLIFELVYRPFRVPDPRRVVNVYQNVQDGGGRMTMGFWTLVSYPEYQRYRDGSTSFSGLAAFRAFTLILSGTTPRRLQAGHVSCNYFETLAIGMKAGRGLGPDDCRGTGGAPVAILSDRLWANEFGSDRAVVGRSIILNGIPVTVVGVATAGFGGVDTKPDDLWVPVVLQPVLAHEEGLLKREAASWLTMVGRLKPGVTMAAAQAELQVVAPRASAGDSGRTVRVTVARGSLVSEPGAQQRAATAGFAFGAVALLVLLLACTNLTTLLLARALSRRRDTALRLALGAGRGRLVAHALTESFLLAAAGGTIGVLLARWVPVAIASAVPAWLMPAVDPRPAWPVIALAVVASIIAAIAVGLPPALQATGHNLGSDVRLGDRSSGGRTHRLRRTLVTGQVAGSALLVALAALFARALGEAARVDLGYRTAGVVAISLPTDELGYPEARAAALYSGLIDRLGALPGVKTVALARGLPLDGLNTSDVESADGSHKAWAAFNTVSPDFFKALDIKTVQGRIFQAAELAAGAERPVVVSETAARALWPDQNPIGQSIVLPLADRAGTDQFTVVGVVENVRSTAIGQLDQPFIYRGLDPARPAGANILVVADPAAASATLTAALSLARTMDPALPPQVGLLDDQVAEAIRPAKTMAGFALALGGLALLLAVVGVYGIVSYDVVERTREYGIRMALGGSAADITVAAVGPSLWTVGVGLVVGGGLAVAAARLLRGWLYGVGVVDLPAFGGMVAIVAAAAVIAVMVPARRIAAIDPLESLRAD